MRSQLRGELAKPEGGEETREHRLAAAVTYWLN